MKDRLYSCPECDNVIIGTTRARLPDRCPACDRINVVTNDLGNVDNVEWEEVRI